jgi:lipid II:glycine glycyltransferase (peptidoglycan interpeptide bridge formation enzyme)
MEVLWTRDLSGADARDYDAFVLDSVGGHPCQTRSWAKVACAGARATTELVLVRDGGRLVGTALVLRAAMAGTRLPWARIERGPVVGRPDDIDRVAPALAQAARDHGIARLRVMPYWAHADALRAEAALRSAGFRDVQQAAGAHAATLRIELGSDRSSDLLAGPARQRARWRANQAIRAGARARRATDADWDRFQSLHSAMLRDQGKRARPGSWWRALRTFASDGDRAAMFACEHAGRVVAACLVVRHGRQCVYAWGASVPERLPFSKTALPLVEAMLWARDFGCEIFDLGGVPLEGDRDRKRNAIAMFKYDFGEGRVPLVREHGIWLVMRPKSHS